MFDVLYRPFYGYLEDLGMSKNRLPLDHPKTTGGSGVGIDVPTFGDWFHITETAISVGDEISPVYSRVM